jgi:rhodanese-related sulfurtransferase
MENPSGMNILKNLFGGTTAASLNATDARARIDAKEKLYLLDVRQPDEFRAGHISGAKLIPLGDLGQRLNELPKDRPILCICRSGSRSSAAARQLASAGYETINLSGGMIGWQNAGLPVKRGK